MNATTQHSSSPERPRLDGKVALVSGAPGATTTAVALAIAEGGAAVALVAPAPEVLRQTVCVGRKRGVPLLPIVSDMTSTEQIAGVLATVTGRLGRVDVAVNIAESPRFNAPYLGIFRQDPGRALELIVLRALLLGEELGRHMAAHKAGSVIVITNPATKRPWPDLAASALRLALLELTTTLSEQWAPHNVLFNAITPMVEATAKPEVVLGTGEIDHAPTSIDPSTLLEELCHAVFWLVSHPARASGVNIQLEGRKTTAYGDLSKHLLDQLLIQEFSSPHRPMPRHLVSLSSLQPRLVEPSAVRRSG